MRAMIQIARNSHEGKPVNLSDIADKTAVSRRYLEQVVIPLKNASLIRGLSGKEGGYLLAKPAEQIKVGDIIQAAIGPINIADCVGDPESCMRVEWCECRPLYVLLNRRIGEAFDAFTLADLAEGRIKEAVEKKFASTTPDKSRSIERGNRGKKHAKRR